MGVDDLLKKAKDSADSLKDKLTDFKEGFVGEEYKQIMDEFKDSGVEKVQEISNMLDESKSYITRSGYDLASLSISLGIPPKIHLSFNYESSISEEERDKLLLEVASKKLLSIILKSLFKAGEFYTNAKFKDYKLGSVDISLGITPGVSIKFIK